VDVDNYLEALEQNGTSLADLAERGGIGRALPTCPGWHVGDLLLHLGFVHRWATAFVAQGITERVATPSESELLGKGGEHDDLLGWFREGHAALVDSLRAADPALVCWTFLDAPSPLAFWARRQAHETAMHRADAELAGGTAPVFDPPFASDGVDELVMGFAPTPRSKAVVEEPKILVVRAQDTADAWQIRFGPGGVETDRATGPHDCLLSAPASDLYLLLWNRLEPHAIEADVEGDAALIELWRHSLRVRW